MNSADLAIEIERFMSVTGINYDDTVVALIDALYRSEEDDE